MTSKKTNEENLDYLLELAIWAKLDSTADLELILLKGHLLLEGIIDLALERNNIEKTKNYSFFRKIQLLQKIDFQKDNKKLFIISTLLELNKLRNKIAHELNSDIQNGQLESIALNILENLKGEKFSRYTFRTKIVHSFSILSINLLELTNPNNKTIANNGSSQITGIDEKV